MKLVNKGVLADFEKERKKVLGGAKSCAVVKFFNPTGAATWFCSEFDEKTGEFFGYANLGDDTCAELGYISLQELESFKGLMGLGIERDIYFEAGKVTMEEVVKKYGRGF